jgi:hypothetical protein
MSKFQRMMDDIRNTSRDSDLEFTKKHSDALRPGQIVMASRYGGEEVEKPSNSRCVAVGVIGTLLIATILGGLAFGITCKRRK